MSSATIRRTVLAAAALGATALLSACSFSASVGAPDYSGEDLAGDITQTLGAQYPDSTFSAMSCDDTPAVAEGETTVCSGVVDGSAMDFTVSWKDSEGSYSVDAVTA